MAARANFSDRSSFCECDLMEFDMAVQKLDMMQITFMRSLLVPVSSGRAGERREDLHKQVVRQVH